MKKSAFSVKLFFREGWKLKNPVQSENCFSLWSGASSRVRRMPALEVNHINLYDELPDVCREIGWYRVDFTSLTDKVRKGLFLVNSEE